MKSEDWVMEWGENSRRKRGLTKRDHIFHKLKEISWIRRFAYVLNGFS